MAPKVNDPFRLDGFDYLLSGIDKLRPGISEFIRPPELEKGDTPFKNGLFNTADLIWTEPAEYFSLVDEQAYALARGRPAMALWARACATVLREKPLAAPAWTLAGRHLPKFPEATSSPDTFDAACELAREVLHIPAPE